MFTNVLLCSYHGVRRKFTSATIIILYLYIFHIHPNAFLLDCDCGDKHQSISCGRSPTQSDLSEQNLTKGRCLSTKRDCCCAFECVLYALYKVLPGCLCSVWVHACRWPRKPAFYQISAQTCRFKGGLNARSDLMALNPQGRKTFCKRQRGTKLTRDGRKQTRVWW